MLVRGLEHGTSASNANVLTTRANRHRQKMECNKHARVSPREIEPSGSESGPSSFVVPDGSEASDFGEPSRFQKVLQGLGMYSNSPFCTIGTGVDAFFYAFVPTTKFSTS
ncbi:auxin response factor 3-like isoform X1 [Olea europaea subsp. europaea]|uniref:Auxin response factor 3-like isoform X1 n=1 Tax=Olea europaea subsp. europaea TaxID=158383 RepID=A0A8S0U0W0_OLEEU|nr:auxin response factor 3-like isoform X1 [Olea europaea subsp. europaea]